MARPALDDDVRELFEAHPARGLIARGRGRSYGDAAQNAGGVVADMTAMTAVRHADWDAGVVTVDGGLGLDMLMDLVIPHGWFPAVVPGTRNVTVGGAIAADVHGKNHHAEGSFANHVKALVLSTPTGELELDPVSTPDVFWATAGGMGLTGVITQATLSLLPVETAWLRVHTQKVPRLDELMAKMEAEDDGYRYAVAWIDSLATGRHLGRGILMHAEHAALDELDAAKRRHALDYYAPERVPAPPLPSGIINRFSIGAFNWLWYLKAPKGRHSGLESVPTYFHPLDGVTDWNRLYGRRGFLQYQFVVPFGAEDTVREAVTRLAEGGAASPVTVLKRFGAANPGHLSFPMPGWTLTLDIPTGIANLSAMLDDLDAMVLSAGGRLYLAKDSRMRAETFAAMYPQLERWREIRAKLDPEGVLRSDMGRRLHLV